MSEPNTEEDQTLARKEHKKCPFLLRTVIDVRNGKHEILTQVLDCLREECALWVKGHKQGIFPDRYYIYEGCGLVSNIFWETRKRNNV